VSPHRIPLLAAVTLLLTACPYHGSFPMGEPQAALFDPRLIGEWLPDEPDEGLETGQLWIARFDEDEYVVVGLGDCPNKGGRAYLTRIGDATFLNVRDPAEPARWSVVRIDFNGTDLIVRPLSDVFDSATSVAHLRAMVQPRLNDPKTYTDSMRLLRTARTFPETGPAAVRLTEQACAYDDTVPLGIPEKLPELAILTGSWRIAPPQISADEEPFEMRVRRFNDTELLITTDDIDGGETHLRAIVTRIAGELFINVNGLDEKVDGELMIARIRMRGDTLEVQSLNNGVRAATPDGLRKIVEARIADPGMYYWQKPILLVRRPSL